MAEAFELKTIENSAFAVCSVLRLLIAVIIELNVPDETVVLPFLTIVSVTSFAEARESDAPIHITAVKIKATAQIIIAILNFAFIIYFLCFHYILKVDTEELIVFQFFVCR